MPSARPPATHFPPVVISPCSLHPASKEAAAPAIAWSCCLPVLWRRQPEREAPETVALAWSAKAKAGLKQKGLLADRRQCAIPCAASWRRKGRHVVPSGGKSLTSLL